jgi:transketolase N-terminal domain/subunit
MKFLSSNAARALAGATLTAAVFIPGAASAAAPAVTSLPCHASMSNNHPKDYTKTYVDVTTVAYAKVITVAHYKTVDRKHTGTANSKGKASIAYYISGATPGYKVIVKVTVSSGSRTGSCSTWFIPHR